MHNYTGLILKLIMYSRWETKSMWCLMDHTRVETRLLLENKAASLNQKDS